jgi:hypothetical protein
MIAHLKHLRLAQVIPGMRSCKAGAGDTGTSTTRVKPGGAGRVEGEQEPGGWSLQSPGNARVTAHFWNRCPFLMGSVRGFIAVAPGEARLPVPYWSGTRASPATVSPSRSRSPGRFWLESSCGSDPFPGPRHGYPASRVCAPLPLPRPAYSRISHSRDHPGRAPVSRNGQDARRIPEMWVPPFRELVCATEESGQPFTNTVLWLG